MLVWLPIVLCDLPLVTHPVESEMCNWSKEILQYHSNYSFVEANMCTDSVA